MLLNERKESNLKLLNAGAIQLFKIKIWGIRSYFHYKFAQLLKKLKFILHPSDGLKNGK